MSGYGAKELANAFRTVRKNTVQIAEDIPENKYDFVAANGSRSVADLLKHIAHAPALYEDMHRVRHVTTLQGYDFPGVIGRAHAAEKQPATKAQIIDSLKTEGERFAKWLESLTPEFLSETFTDHAGQNPRTRLESLLSPKEHEMHHRAQLMLIERILGIVPHLTRQMEERMRARQTAVAG
ncbi:MAG TPA: DinB family protein [Gemmatimonadaceae bacterium]|nr:DinB family protein [Gemmatimonadaceae bacterium]